MIRSLAIAFLLLAGLGPAQAMVFGAGRALIGVDQLTGAETVALQGVIPADGETAEADG
jgi:hypothetical protein